MLKNQVVMYCKLLLYSLDKILTLKDIKDIVIYLRCFILVLPVFLGDRFPTFLPGGVVLPTDD